jgi:CRISPR system Cascade subunit CasD
VSDRFYLADATFLVALEGERDLLESIDSALWAPTWPLFLGRKSFVPTPPLSLGVQHEDLESALTNTPWQVRISRLRSAARRQLEDGSPQTLLAILDADSETGDDTRNDVPVSFSDRRFTTRHIRRMAVPLTAALLASPVDEQEASVS